MQKFKVDLLSTGGHRIDPLIVEAGNQEQAKALAVLIANAQAKAKGESYIYRAISVKQA